jgi:hypothetical protein
MTAPIRHIALPSLPNVPNSSLRKYAPSTAPINTDSAPNGVTKMAGAKAYAAKLKISPQTTAHSVVSTCRCLLPGEGVKQQGARTADDASPPHRALQIYKPVTLEAMTLLGMHQSLISQKSRSAQLSLSCDSKVQRCGRAVHISLAEGLFLTFLVMTKLVPGGRTVSD